MTNHLTLACPAVCSVLNMVMFVKVTVSMQYLGSKDAPVAKPSSAIFVKFIANGNVVEVLFSLLCITPYPHCLQSYNYIRYR